MWLAEFEGATDFVQPFAALGTSQACVALTQNALSLCATLQSGSHRHIIVCWCCWTSAFQSCRLSFQQCHCNSSTKEQMCHMHFLWVEILVEAKCNNCHAQPNCEQIPPPLSRLQSWTVGCQHPVEHIKTPHAFVPPCTMCGWGYSFAFKRRLAGCTGFTAVWLLASVTHQVVVPSDACHLAIWSIIVGTTLLLLHIGSWS